MLTLRDLSRSTTIKCRRLILVRVVEFVFAVNFRQSHRWICPCRGIQGPSQRLKESTVIWSRIKGPFLQEYFGRGVGRSVLPSSRDNTNEPMVERTCSSGLHNNGYIALIRASSAALVGEQLSLPIANFSNFTAAENSSVLLLGTSGTCGSVH